MEFHTRTEHNTIMVDPVIRDDQALIHIGTPSHTTTPYDTYARMMAKSARIAFARSRIDATVVCCHRRIAALAFGSGPEGSVRFGDDMLPPDVMAVVALDDADRARQAWENFQGRKYLSKPYSVIGHLWYNPKAYHGGTVAWHGGGGAWVPSGAWTRTIINAIAIATAIGRDTSRLQAYLARRPNID